MQRDALRLIVLWCLLACGTEAEAGIVVGPFGTFGQGGSDNGQTFTFGSGGNVFEIDSFLNVNGLDLNGGTLGTSAQLSVDALPSGLAFSFTPTLSGDTTDVTLTYEFNNNTGGVLSDVQFFSFLDAEIDVATNTYYNEAGSVSGSAGGGAGDSDPDSWEIDEPGYVFGDIFDNLRLGSLDNTNNVPTAFPDDVSMALGFRLGDLQPLDRATINIFLSEDADSIGSLALTHFDSGVGSSDTFTMSGQSNVEPVPEPSSLAIGLVLTGFGVAVGWRARRRKTAAK